MNIHQPSNHNISETSLVTVQCTGQTDSHSIIYQNVNQYCSEILFLAQALATSETLPLPSCNLYVFMAVTVANIDAAAARLHGRIHRTALLESIASTYL